MRLKEWLNRKTRIPLLVAAGIALVLVAFQFYRLEKQTAEYRGQAIRHLSEVASLALRQKNRMLIESALNATEWQIGSRWAALCEKGRVAVGSRIASLRCPDVPAAGTWGLFRDDLVRREVQGFSGYEIRAEIPWYFGKASLLLLIAVSGALIACILLLLRRVQHSLRSEILEPLGAGLLSDTPLKINELEQLRHTIAEAHEVKTREAISQAVIRRGQQVAHDIRSPLAALDMILETLPAIPEEKRVPLRSALSRIRDIANDLRQSSESRPATGQALTESGTEETRSVQLISSLVEDLITEKRMQYRSRLKVEIDMHRGLHAYGAFAEIQPAEFKRALSNLIDNGVEALKESGKVEASLSVTPSQIVLEVRDNGKGIPADVLPRLGQRGESFGKAEGSGLGLYHARSTIEALSGCLEIQSEVNQGTVVTLRVPRAVAPAWFLPHLKVRAKQKVVIVDDDVSIHRVWEERFRKARTESPDIQLIHFSSPSELQAWHGDNCLLRRMPRGDSDDAPIYLVDYEFLGQRESGLDLIERLGIARQSVLVTSRYEDAVIRERSERLGVRLIPKGLSGFVPIQVSRTDVEASQQNPDAVLIDDDELIHRAWQLSASKFHKRLRAFATLNQLEPEIASLDRATPIYVDVNLSNGDSGKAVSKRLHEMGFTELFLCTGMTAAEVGSLPWIKGIMDKKAPWAGST